MNYDFDTVIDRRNTDSEKWNVGENVLPMWVADMDFPLAPGILDALKGRMEHGIFGYTAIPDAWYQAYIGWWQRRHGLKMKKEELLFSAGVIPSISSIIRKLTTANENVVIQTPVYNHFFNCIENNGCRALESPLSYRGGGYTIDFADLEQKLADPQTSLMILCNPHNPVGRIWSKEELAKIGELAKKHHVTVISDEIHCDITKPGKGYVPFASVSEICRGNSITCISSTKAFNMAGLHTSAVFVPDPVLRHKIWRALNTDEVAEPNAFAAVAATAAFEKGEEWLDSLREYVFENRKLVEDFLKSELPEVVPVKGEATYLVWLDISAVSDSGKKLASFLKRNTGLFLIGGNVYGAGGEHFLRMNVACPKSVCMDGLDRLKNGIRAFEQEKHKRK